MIPTRIARTPLLALLALLAALAAALPARAQVTVEGQTFEPRARVADADLRLNGVGLRAVAWLKGYAAGLYLPRKTESAAEVLAMGGAKRLQLRMLQEAPSVEFVKAFDRGIARNTPADAMPALKDRMQRFDDIVLALGKVRKGDVVDLDFVPGKGLVFIHNGKPLGEPIAGEDLYAAMLRIFVGEKPVDKELKIGLLGGPIS